MSHTIDDASDTAQESATIATVKSPVKDDKSSDLTRQTGDLSLYKFYMDSVGAFYFILWLALAAAYIGFGKAPRMSTGFLTRHNITMLC